MESIEQPIFNPYGIDDKDELIDDPTPSSARHIPNANSNDSDTSPIQAAKSLLSSGKDSFVQTSVFIYSVVVVFFILSMFTVYRLSNQNRGLLVIIISTVVFAIIITVALILTIYLLPKQIGGHAAVVTEVGLCSDIGLDVMTKGGNAVDAAVAAAFCLSVVHPQSSGIGGGGFLLYHDHKNFHSVAYDFRETAPTLATKDMLSRGLDVDMSGKAVGVPGELKGLAEVHREWGNLEWSVLVQPSINLARGGFNITENLANSLAHHTDMKKLSRMGSYLLKYYSQEKISPIGGLPRREWLKKGDFVKREDLAETLELIKEDGADAFYLGNLGDNFVEMVQENGGVMTKIDLEEYTVVKQKPVQSTFKGNKVLGMPAPSSGPVVALILNMLEGFNWTEQSISNPDTYQQMIETFKFGFGHRTLLGDPANADYADAIKNASAQFVSADFAASLRSKVDNTTHTPDYYGPVVSPTLNQGTTQISIIDSNEVMISLTLTNNYWFGSKLMTSDGILANNEMMDFSLPTAVGSMPPNSRNMIVPRMRPLSSMTPTIIYNHDHPCSNRAVLGASNGTRIITGVVETLVNSFIFNMGIRDAVAYPRIHQQLYPNANTFYEDIVSKAAPNGSAVFSKKIRDALTDQTWVKATEGLSCVQAIMKVNDKLEAFSDWRKGGHAATF